MKRAVECIGRALVDTLLMAAVMVMVVVLMPLWIIAEILDDE